MVSDTARHMLLLRMVVIALRLAWPHLLTPWRSSLLRWRIETYGLCDPEGRILHAGEITPARFTQFIASHPRALWHFLLWAARL